MRKLAHCSLALATLCVANTSHAGNSVTLYGIAESDLVYTSNAGGHSSYQLASGLLSGSRWGLLGSEDLGNNLSAIFRLENGFSLDTGKLGQNGRIFGRSAYVGLSDSKVGQLTLGRQYMTSTDYLANLTLGSLGVGAPARHPYDNDNLGATIRSDHSVKFQSANFNGFQFGGLFGFSNAAGRFSDGRAYDLSAAYTYGGLSIAANYAQIDNAGSVTDTSGAVSTADTAFYAGRHRVWGAGVNYAFGDALVGMVYTQTQLNNATAITTNVTGTSTNVALTNGSARFQNYELNGRYRFTPSFIVLGGYTFTDARIDGVSPKYHQVTLEADYVLSKRSDVYVVGTYQHVTNTANSGITAHVIAAGSSSTSKQAVALVGFRHRF